MGNKKREKEKNVYEKRRKRKRKGTFKLSMDNIFLKSVEMQAKRSIRGKYWLIVGARKRSISDREGRVEIRVFGPISVYYRPLQLNYSISVKSINSESQCHDLILLSLQ